VTTAIALVESISNDDSGSTFTVGVRYVLPSSIGTQGTVYMYGVTPGILEAVFEQNIKTVVKNALGLGALDSVRLIGATLV